jgi:hypothetical protein
VEQKGNLRSPDVEFGKFLIADTNPGDLLKFKSTIELTKGIINSYRVDIEKLNLQATSLIKFLKEEYHLKDD